MYWDGEGKYQLGALAIDRIRVVVGQVVCSVELDG